MRKTIQFFIVFVLLLMIISGCTTKKEESHRDKMDTEHAANGDLRETTTSVHTMPKFLADKSDQIKTIYAAVAEHEQLLEQMPCYCGCGDSAGHLNNYDCFVFDRKKEGQITWDDHGTRCGVCMEIAAESISQFNDGKSAYEVRQLIDEKYKEGYAKPTPTPMPKKS